MIRIVESKIDREEIVQSVSTPESGAIATFDGTVRNHSREKPVTYLHYEAFPEMALKELVGESEMEMQLEKKTSVRNIFQQLETRFPEIKRYESILLVAVNMEYADLDSTVTPGDEVCFFPPVSGGAG